MKRFTLVLVVTCFGGWALIAGAQHGDIAKKAAKADPSKRVLWQSSRITGSPEPPAPYRMERVFPKLEFKNPVLLVRAPGTDRLFVAEQAGPIYSFKPN